MDKKQRDLNEFVDSHESKIDWFDFVTPEKARETLNDLDNRFKDFEKKYGWKLSDKAKEIIIARLSEIAKKNNTFNLKINIDLMPKTLEQQREDAWRMYIYHSSNTSYWFGVVKELDEEIIKQGRTNNEPESN